MEVWKWTLWGWMELLLSACSESDHKQMVIIVLLWRNAESKNYLRSMQIRNCYAADLRAVGGWIIASGQRQMTTRGAGRILSGPRRCNGMRTTEKNNERGCNGIANVSMVWCAVRQWKEANRDDSIALSLNSLAWADVVTDWQRQWDLKIV